MPESKKGTDTVCSMPEQKVLAVLKEIELSLFRGLCTEVFEILVKEHPSV